MRKKSLSPKRTLKTLLKEKSYDLRDRLSSHTPLEPIFSVFLRMDKMGSRGFFLSKVFRVHFGDKRKNSKGVALLMVIAAVSLLSALVLEFVDSSRITFDLAINQEERVQAYYLAQSALSFSELIIKYDQESKKLAQDASKRLGRDIQVPPLYEMIPVSSALYKQASHMGSETEDSTEEGSEEAVPQTEGIQVGMLDQKKLEDFLSFEGDFASEISEEEAKLNLNAFYILDTKRAEYDRLKNTLYYLFVISDDFKDLFEDRFRSSKELVQNIADYIDKDTVFNEAGGQERGRETFEGGSGVKNKNAKLLSVDELMMVPGMTEAIFEKLKEYVTVYGRDEKIYLCRSEEVLVQAVIVAYTENNSKMELLKFDNKELLTKATETVMGSCPNLSTMAGELDKVLGVDVSTTVSGRPTAGSTGAEGASGGPTANSFEKLLKDDNKIFGIKGIGTLEDSQVVISVVLDASNAQPKSWKYLYRKVD